MTAPRIVPPQEARALAKDARSGKLGAAVPLWRTAPDLAYTAVVLGEQRDAALALHAGDEFGWCEGCSNSYPCPTARALGVEA